MPIKKTQPATSGDCPSCFANAQSSGTLPACKTCQYIESCRYCADNPAPGRFARDSKGHHVSLEAYAFAEEIAATDDVLTAAEEVQQPEAYDYDQPIYTNADMQHMLEFMLRGVDDYTLAIVECVLREKHTTASQVARAFDVSREAIHRKLVDSCKQYPVLSEVLRCALHRCKMLADPAKRGSITGRRARADKSGTHNHKKTQEHKQQMEFTFNAEF